MRIALAALLLVQSAAAQPRPDPNPDATVEIEEVRVGVLVLGATFGGGRLHYRGRDYAFTVRGFEFGSVGVASTSARGEVFGLAALTAFAGSYAEEERAQPLGGEAGPQPLWLRNAAGVVMRLRSDRDGGVLRIAPGGLSIAFRE